MHMRHALPRIWCLAWLCAAPVFAHHSTAMFEPTKTKTLSGAVKAFQWSNPHCWIQLVVVGDDAGEWSIEMGSPGQVFRGGWRPGSLKPGDKITVLVHPMRDGTQGGLLLSGTSADGKPLGHHT